MSAIQWPLAGRATNETTEKKQPFSASNWRVINEQRHDTVKSAALGRRLAAADFLDCSGAAAAVSSQPPRRNGRSAAAASQPRPRRRRPLLPQARGTEETRRATARRPTWPAGRACASAAAAAAAAAPRQRQSHCFGESKRGKSAIDNPEGVSHSFLFSFSQRFSERISRLWPSFAYQRGKKTRPSLRVPFEMLSAHSSSASSYCLAETERSRGKGHQERRSLFIRVQSKYLVDDNLEEHAKETPFLVSRSCSEVIFGIEVSFLAQRFNMGCLYGLALMQLRAPLKRPLFG